MQYFHNAGLLLYQIGLRNIFLVSIGVGFTFNPHFNIKAASKYFLGTSPKIQIEEKENTFGTSEKILTTSPPFGIDKNLTLVESLKPCTESSSKKENPEPFTTIIESMSELMNNHSNKITVFDTPVSLDLPASVTLDELDLPLPVSTSTSTDLVDIKEEAITSMLNNTLVTDFKEEFDRDSLTFFVPWRYIFLIIGIVFLTAIITDLAARYKSKKFSLSKLYNYFVDKLEPTKDQDQGLSPYSKEYQKLKEDFDDSLNDIKRDFQKVSGNLSEDIINNIQAISFNDKICNTSLTHKFTFLENQIQETNDKVDDLISSFKERQLTFENILFSRFDDIEKEIGIVNQNCNRIIKDNRQINYKLLVIEQKEQSREKEPISSIF